MKKIVSILVILSMLIAFIPTAFANETSTAPADVVYDFTSLPDTWTYSSGTAGYNFSFNETKGHYSWKIVPAASGDGVRLNVNENFDTTASRYNRAAIDIVVSESGWYLPSFTGGYTIQGAKASIFLGAKYLGDYDFTYTGEEVTSNMKCVPGEEKTLNAVYLEAGTHTLVIGFRARSAENTDTFYPFLQNFKLYGLDAEPTISSVNSIVPSVMNIGDNAQLTAQLIDSNGNAISFGDQAAYNAITANTTNYLAVTSDNDAVVKVTSYAKGGLCNSENTNYSIVAVGGGVANLVFTPYIDGVAQESYTKSVSVAGPIIIDFSKTTDKITATPGYTVAEFGQSISGNWRKPTNEMIRVTLAAASAKMWHEGGGQSTKIAINVNVPEAGFYSIKLWGGLSRAGGLMSMYANGSYVGDYDFTTDDASTDNVYGIDGEEKTLNTVYLDEGSNMIFLGLRKSLSTYADSRIFLKKITVSPVDSMQGKTEIGIKSVASTDVPTTMLVGDTAESTAVVTMEDNSVHSFAAYKISGYTVSADDIDSVTVTSSAPDIISVESYEDDALGASDKTTFTLKANAAGSADITVAAKVGDSTKTATYTITASEYNPNSITTNPTVSVYIGAENADASLITVSKGGIAAGVVDGTVARGTTITATAESNEDYEFIYWMDNAKRYIQDDETYTFTAGTNTAVFAVYADKTDTFKLFDYFTDSGTRVYSVEAEDEAEIITPELEMTGYTGGAWKKTIDNAEYVTFTPDWENATKATTSVTLNGAAYESGSYGDKVTVNKTSDSFVSWKKNGNIVSYDDTYTFYMWDVLEALVESTEGEKSNFPAVALFENGGKYMLELINCDGVEIVEKGILFGGTIDSCLKKFVSRTNLSQFTIIEDTYTDAKAYVIYRDGADLRVAYSD